MWEQLDDLLRPGVVEGQPHLLTAERHPRLSDPDDLLDLRPTDQLVGLRRVEACHLPVRQQVRAEKDLVELLLEARVDLLVEQLGLGVPCTVRPSAPARKNSSPS